MRADSSPRSVLRRDLASAAAPSEWSYQFAGIVVATLVAAQTSNQFEVAVRLLDAF
jgi:hypothetical protein